MYAVILAGGIGKRFWPRSRRDRPKQILDLLSEQSMLEITYNRLLKITDKKKIYVVTGKKLFNSISGVIREIPKKNFILEPSRKDTAASIGLVAGIIESKDPDAMMGVFPADHLIENEEDFLKDIKLACSVASDHVSLVTFGTTPTRPSTNFGYIQIDTSKPMKNNNVFKVKTFAEKPNLSTAKRFLETKEFLWNSGMFIWKTTNIINAIKYNLPELYDSIGIIVKAFGSVRYNSILKKQWSILRKISIDYGILEKSKNVYVVKSNFKWQDLGSWNTIFNLKTKDKDGNVLEGNVETIDTEGCFVHSKKHLIATVGVKDLIIIQSKGATMIVHKDESERVKELVDLLDYKKRSDYL